MGLKFQTLYATCFAVVMALAVIAFPTPYALLNAGDAAVSSIEGLVPKRETPPPAMPPLTGAPETPDELALLLDYCAQHLSNARSLKEGRECARLLETSSEFLTNPADQAASPPLTLTPIQEQAFYVSAQLCRLGWAAAETSRNSPSTCDAELLALALHNTAR